MGAPDLASGRHYRTASPHYLWYHPLIVRGVRLLPWHNCIVWNGATPYLPSPHTGCARAAFFAICLDMTAERLMCVFARPDALLQRCTARHRSRRCCSIPNAFCYLVASDVMYDLACCDGGVALPAKRHFLPAATAAAPTQEPVYAVTATILRHRWTRLYERLPSAALLLGSSDMRIKAGQRRAYR